MLVISSNDVSRRDDVTTLIITYRYLLVSVTIKYNNIQCQRNLIYFHFCCRSYMYYYCLFWKFVLLLIHVACSCSEKNSITAKQPILTTTLTIRFTPSRPNVHINWQHYDNPDWRNMTNTPRTRTFQHYSNDHYLVISNTSKADEGLYRVTEDNGCYCDIEIVLKGIFQQNI